MATNVKDLNMTLHCGGQLATREQVWDVQTPPQTATYFPLGHRSLVERVEKLLPAFGIEIHKANYALAKGGDRFFGMFAIGLQGFEATSYQRILALRNSLDGSMTAGFVIGSQVFVCDNLAFSGEIVVARKHTKNMLRDLPGLLYNAMARIPLQFKLQDDRAIAYQNAELSRKDSDHLILELHRKGVLSVTDIRRLLREYEGTEKDGVIVHRHADFAPRNAWSLFNAATEVLKNIDSKGNPQPNLWDLPRQTKDLHDTLDAYLGVAIDVEAEVLPE